MKTICKQTKTVKTFDLFKEREGGGSLKESTVFTVFVCLQTVFITVFKGFHSFHMFCSILCVTPMCYMPPRMVLGCCVVDIIKLAKKHIHTCMHINADGNGAKDITMFERCSCVLGCASVVGEGAE